MLAAALSFYTMLALSPLLILIAAFANPILGEEGVRSEIVARLGKRLGSHVASVVDTAFENLGEGASGLWPWLLGLVLMLLTTSRLFVHLQDSLNRIESFVTSHGERISRMEGIEEGRHSVR